MNMRGMRGTLVTGGGGVITLKYTCAQTSCYAPGRSRAVARADVMQRCGVIGKCPANP